MTTLHSMKLYVLCPWTTSENFQVNQRHPSTKNLSGRWQAWDREIGSKENARFWNAWSKLQSYIEIAHYFSVFVFLFENMAQVAIHEAKKALRRELKKRIAGMSDDVKLKESASIVNKVSIRPFYSYGWKRGWGWPCFDTNLPALLFKSSYSYTK